MKILFTGGSSFTGFWFVRTLAAAGHEIVCPVTRSLDSYTDIRRQRVETLKPLCRFVPDAAFGSDNFLKLASSEKFDLLCHHAAEMKDYRSPDFDAMAALQSNVLNTRTVLKTLQCPVILTGSVFENDEGTDSVESEEEHREKRRAPAPPLSSPKGGEGRGEEASSFLRAFSPYGLSKGLTYQYFRYYCHAAGIPLGKFVIPNPFGPYEEPRFTAHLMRNWKAGTIAEVKTPDYLRDNIHADLLALIYAQFCRKVSGSNNLLLKSNPSGYAETQGAFAQRTAREVQSRTGWPCELKLAQQTDFSEPLARVNTEPAAKLNPDWNEKKAWDGFVEFYTGV